MFSYYPHSFLMHFQFISVLSYCPCGSLLNRRSESSLKAFSRFFYCSISHSHFSSKNSFSTCDNIPTGRSPLSKPTKPTHGHPMVWWFLSSPARAISHCFINTQDTTCTTEKVEEKKNKQARTWVSSKRKKGEVFDTFLVFLCFRGPSWACIWAKFQHSYQERRLILSRLPIRPLSPQVLAPRSAAEIL